MDKKVRKEYDVEVEQFITKTAHAQRNGTDATICTIFLILGLILFFGSPVMLVWEMNLVVVLGLTGFGIIMVIVTNKISDNLEKYSNYTDCSFVARMKYVHKVTFEEKYEYYLITGYSLLEIGLAEIKTLYGKEGFMLPKTAAREAFRIGMLREKQIEDNAKLVDELIHRDEFQKEIRKALLANNTECGPFIITELKDLRKEGKKPHCTICSVDGGRGLRNEVIIPNECLVEEMFQDT